MAAIGGVRGVINTKNSLERCEEVDKEIDFFFHEENKENEDLLLEARDIYEEIAKLLWKIKIYNN